MFLLYMRENRNLIFLVVDFINYNGSGESVCRRGFRNAVKYASWIFKFEYVEYILIYFCITLNLIN